MNKKWKIGIGLSAALVLTSATVPLVVTLSSCSSTKKPKFEYIPQTNSLEVDSKALFGKNNIFYGFQMIKYGSVGNYSTQKYDLTNAINKLVQSETGNENFNIGELDTSNVTNESNSSPFSLVVNVKGAKSKNTTIGDIQKVVINFPSIKENDLPWQSPIEVQSGVYFPNQTIQDVMAQSTDQILSAIGNSTIPEGTVVGSNKAVINNQTALEIDLFVPNSGITKLIVNFAPVEVPNVNPSAIIANTGIKNNWQSIINWSPTIPENINYTTIDNPTGKSKLNGKSILSSYSLAIEGKNLLDKFNSTFYVNPSKNGATILNDKQLNTDVDYFIKNYLADVANTWDGQNILNSNVYSGNNLKTNGNLINGKIVIQFQNTSNKTQTLKLPISNTTIKVNNNDVVSIVINLDNSQISPYLIQKDARQNTAYLSTAFTNVSMNVTVNDMSVYGANFGANPTNIFPYSIVLKTIVGNVKDGENYLTESQEFQQLYEKEFENQTRNGEVNQEVYTNAIKETVQNSLNTMNDIILGIQNIAELWSNNPTILDFLEGIGSDVYRILFAITKNEELSRIISNLFNAQPVSVFLFNNWRNLVDLLKGLNIPSLQTQIDALITLIEQIGNENSTLAEMKQWIKNVSSLYGTLEKVFSGNQSMNWLLPLFKHLMDTLSEDPPIFTFIFMNLNSILVNLQNEKLGVGKGIVAGIAEYMNGLMEYAKTANSSKNRANDLVGVANEDVSDSATENDPTDLTKYNNIHVMDPILYANKSNSYKSLFTCISENTSGTLSTVFKYIGMIFDGVKYSNFNSQTNLKQAIDSFIYPSIELSNKKTENIDIYTLFTKYLLVEPSIKENNLVFKYSFSNKVTWDFSKLQSWLGNIKLSIKTGNDKIDSLISLLSGSISLLNLGGYILPKKLIVDSSNFININYSLANKNLYPSIDSNGDLSWKFRVTKSIYINLNQMKTDMEKKEGLIVKTDSWNTAAGSILSGILKPVLEGQGIKLPQFIYDIINYGSFPKMIFEFVNGLFKNSVTQNTWIYANSKLGKKFENFDTSAGLPNVSFELNKDWNGTKFRTWLKSQILSNVQWETPSQSGGSSTAVGTPVMIWNKPANFEKQLSTYLKLGSAFNNEAYPFVDWSTDLGAFKITIDSNLYTVYDFHINFSTPTIVKDALGKYSVKDRVDYFFIQTTTNSSKTRN